jgi:nifR3 family TIM-barrel protein
MKNFWKKLPKPFFCLAPMADVTDPAFRKLISKYGKPHVFWTEFVSADGLCSNKGKEALLNDLKYSKKEKPIVAQIFTSKPENMKKAAKIIYELGFDGIDINMGCPDKKVEKQGAGAKLIKNPSLARELIRSAKIGAPKLPISVKTRIGYSKNELKTWLPELLKEKPSAITIHFRTRKQMSKAKADWENASVAVKIRDRLSKETLIIGNGDVKDIEDAKKKAKNTGVDGVMIGRAIFGNPWLFLDKKNISSKEKIQALIEHIKLFEKLCGYKPFNIMKKHFKAYVSGWNGAKKLRIKLMEAENFKEAQKILSKQI